jgi:Ca2+-binding EF-hand superfamily protein
MKGTFTAMLASVALVATSAAAQQPQGTTAMKKNLENVNPSAMFASWDTDNSSRLSKQEFATALRGQEWFQRVDADRNGWISKPEFKTHLTAMHVYRTADLNDNGTVEVQEANRLLGSQRAAEWNQRQPASLSEDELYEGLYAAWGKPGAAGLTPDEMLAGAFTCADRDDNGMISKAEFARDIALARGDAADRSNAHAENRTNSDHSANRTSNRSERDPSGSDRTVGTTGAVAAATVEDIVDNPDSYIGENVTVAGNVGEVFGTRVFNIEEEGIIDVDDELMVVAPKDSAIVTEDANVQVRGKVRRIVTRDLEAAYGPTYWSYWGVDRDFFVTRESRPVLFADAVDVRR